MESARIMVIRVQKIEIAVVIIASTTNVNIAVTIATVRHAKKKAIAAPTSTGAMYKIKNAALKNA